jgi:hypothetical protein
MLAADRRPDATLVSDRELRAYGATLWASVALSLQRTPWEVLILLSLEVGTQPRMIGEAF